MENIQKCSAASVEATETAPLCVDLDGTLVKTDTLIESVLLLLKTKPLFVLLMPLWLLKGKANLKRQIARQVTLDVASLPYHPSLLAYLEEQHRRGRTIILTTAAEHSIAHGIADHLKLFTNVLATNGSQNLSGAEKLKHIKRYVGSSEFVYAGNGRVDLPIWRYSKGAILVNAPDHLVRTVTKIAAVGRVFNEQLNPVQAFIKAIRTYQWVKNGLIFVPLIAGHQVTDPTRLLAAIIAFGSFCFCSSSTYLLNDLLDLEADRRHPRKKHRPFASGDLPVKLGLMVTPLFLFAGLALSLLLPIAFTVILSAYCILTVGYSFFLKRVEILDVILLALLYTTRIVAGGVATDIQISSWLLGFSMFLFLSLALLKRYSELHDHICRSKEADKSRGYFTGDIEQLASMGSASGYMTATVLGLYINSADVKALYAHPEILWLICPLILYWISRAWLIARRGRMNDDPLVFAIRDKTSYAVGILAATVVLFAIG